MARSAPEAAVGLELDGVGGGVGVFRERERAKRGREEAFFLLVRRGSFSFFQPRPLLSLARLFLFSSSSFASLTLLRPPQHLCIQPHSIFKL